MQERQGQRPLAISDFRPPPRTAVSGMPLAVKLGGKIAEGLALGLQRVSGASWRVALDRIDDEPDSGGDEQSTIIRVESQAGSMTLRVGIDRQGISALIEAAMGGTGSEAPFEIAERPLSAIEGEVLALAIARLSDETARAMSDQFGRPVSLFRGDFDFNGDAAGGGLTTFRFVANVFGYSGEIRLSTLRHELKAQIEASEKVAGGSQHRPEKQAELQREIGRSELDFTVSLGPETLRVEQIAALKPGSMLRLAATTAMPVIVWSGGNPVHFATLARAGEHLAVKIIAAAE